MARVGVREAVAGALLAGTLLAQGCGGAGGQGAAGAAGAARPPILLLVADTLRADRLGCYGYGRPTSPAIDRLAATAVRFTRAHATAPWTLPSHASLFTGLYPFQHGVHTLEPAQAGSGKEPIRPLARRFRTLAEVLREEGYETAAFCANAGYLAPRYRLDQGFDTYRMVPGTADVVNEAVFEWLRGRRPKPAGGGGTPPTPRPFFLFVNYMDTHSPYNTRPRAGFLGGSVPLYSADRMERLYRAVVGRSGQAGGEDLRILADQYDLSIRNLDAGVGDLLSELVSLGIFHRSLILFTADHGEYLGEHDLLEHSKDVYEQALRVPLVVKEPRETEGRLDERLVSLVHVPGLVLEQLGLGRDPRYREDFPYRRPGGAILAENHFTRRKDLRAPWGERFRRIRFALLEGARKYIRSSDGKDELFDLETDASEGRNLLGGDRSEGRGWREKLEAMRAVRPYRGGGESLPPLSEEEKRRLRDLGYIEK